MAFSARSVSAGEARKKGIVGGNVVGNPLDGINEIRSSVFPVTHLLFVCLIRFSVMHLIGVTITGKLYRGANHSYSSTFFFLLTCSALVSYSFSLLPSTLIRDS